MLRVLGCLHHVTAAALGLPRDFFDPYYTPCASVSLRLAYYPPVPEASQASSVETAAASERLRSLWIDQ